MSHVAAWERLLAGEEECALVLEDDVVPLLGLPARLGGLGLPAEWDIVWLNDRMVPRLDTAAEGFSLHPLAGIVQSFWPETTAPGADGYLVSREGARRLLALVARDGMADDVDWRMVAYCMTAAEVAAIPEGVHARSALQILARPGQKCGSLPGEGAAPLRGHVLHPPLFREVGLASQRDGADGVANAV